jgi:hypothetical protein
MVAQQTIILWKYFDMDLFFFVLQEKSTGLIALKKSGTNNGTMKKQHCPISKARGQPFS